MCNEVACRVLIDDLVLAGVKLSFMKYCGSLVSGFVIQIIYYKYNKILLCGFLLSTPLAFLDETPQSRVAIETPYWDKNCSKTTSHRDSNPVTLYSRPRR